MDAARDGQRSALELLLARHQGRLLSWMRASFPADLAPRVGPEDVLQETLLEAARRLDAYEDRGPASFYRWLVGIARYKLSEARRHARAARRAPRDAEVHGLEGEPEGVGTSPSLRVSREETGDALREALGDLPERQGEAVRLRYLEGLSLAETAERLETSPSAVKALVSRGMAALAARRPGRG